MTRKQRRLVTVVSAMLGLGVATSLVLSAFNDNLVFFYSPTDIIEKSVPEGRRLRIGGLVEEKSVTRTGDHIVKFRVTDTANTIPVIFRGALPDLFREGQGVVAEGVLGPDRLFLASNVLAKHDENYMPPEVADALKKSGHWQESAKK